MQEHHFNSYADAREWLYGLRNRGSKYGIDRMAILADVLGHPQRSYPAIHVAGTNGKGSVCAMLERVYREGGYRTGLFSSPHLVHQGERIRIDGIPMEEEGILHWTNVLIPECRDLAKDDPDNHPSFFEWMTAMAFLQFKESAVDVAVLETGLGGRLDSTNVVLPEVSVITSIGLDHVEILGNSFAKIAAEKGGIIKEGVPVVLGKMPVEAREVLERMARDRGSKTYPVEDHFANGKLPQTNLAGNVQRWNAGVVQIVCEVLASRFPLAQDVIERGLSSVEIKGRWSLEWVGERKLIFDGAHNKDALEALRWNLESLASKEGKKPVIVAGFTGNAARAKEMLPMLKDHSSRVILVRPAHDRGLPPEDYNQSEEVGNVQNIFPRPGVCNIDPVDATVVVTGSLYLVAEVMGRLEEGSSGSRQQQLQD